MEVIGWLVDDEYYCSTCTPTNDEDLALPIYKDTEVKAHCVICGEPTREELE